LWVAAGLVTSTVVGAEPTIPAQVDTSIYDSFAQAEGQAPVTLMPRAGVPDESVDEISTIEQVNSTTQADSIIFQNPLINEVTRRILLLEVQVMQHSLVHVSQLVGQLI